MLLLLSLSLSFSFSRSLISSLFLFLAIRFSFSLSLSSYPPRSITPPLSSSIPTRSFAPSFPSLGSVTLERMAFTFSSFLHGKSLLHSNQKGRPPRWRRVALSLSLSLSLFLAIRYTATVKDSFCNSLNPRPRGAIFYYFARCPVMRQFLSDRSFVHAYLTLLTLCLFFLFFLFRTTSSSSPLRF